MFNKSVIASKISSQQSSRGAFRMNQVAITSVAVVVVLSMCVGCSQAATFYTLPKIHPDHPLKCHWPEMLDRALIPGEKVTGKECVRLTCLPNFSVLGSTCPPFEEVYPDMECVELPGDSEQEYPACCPRLKCVQKIFENELY